MIIFLLFVKNLKNELTHLQIDNDLNNAKFANPNATFGRKGGIWEIECKCLDLFWKCAVFEFRIRIKQRTKQNTEIDISKLLELKSMSKLKTFNM